MFNAIITGANEFLDGWENGMRLASLWILGVEVF